MEKEVDPFVFLLWDELLVGHRDLLTEYGGQDGFIDENAVHAALARPEFKAKYDPDADLADLAAAYFFGLCTTQGFVDGNKRTATFAATVFLRKNGWKLALTNDVLYTVAMSVANSSTDEETLARIVRDHLIVIEENEV